MAARTATKTGNWSDVSVWDGGATLPGAGDTADSNGYTVTIDQNITVTALVGTNAGAGGFTVASAYTIAANITATVRTVLTCTHTTGTVTITGTLQAGSTSGHAVLITGTGGTTAINATSITGGVSNCRGVLTTGIATVNITCNSVTGGTAGGAYGVMNSQSGTTTITGNVIGGSANDAAGARNDGSGAINVSGSATGGSAFGSYGLHNASTGTVSCNTAVGGSAQGAVGLYGSNTGGTTTFAIAQWGATGFVPVGGACKMEWTQASSYIRVLRSTGATVDLSDDYPAIAKVESGTVYKLGGLTGTLAACDYPAEADVQSGVSYGSGVYTGAFASPAAGDVRSGTTYGAATEYTGTLDLPAVADVQSGVTFDGASKTGTFVAPAVGDVQSGVTYGAAAEYTGTFTEPGVGNVEAGVQYGASGTEYTGTFVVPAEADVKLGVEYGAAAEFTGSYAPAGGGDWTDEEKAQIRYRLQLDGTQSAPTDTDLPAVNVTLWKDATAPAMTGDAYAVLTNATYGLDKLARTGADADTLETLSDQLDAMEPTDVWAYTSRTLTALPSATTDGTTAGSITRRRGDSWSIALTALGAITGYTSVWMTVKGATTDADTAAVLQVKKNASLTGDGLLYVNGAAASDATKASITIVDASTGAITIAVDESITDDMTPGTYCYDVQSLVSGAVTTLDSGTFTVTADVTRSIT